MQSIVFVLGVGGAAILVVSSVVNFTTRHASETVAYNFLNSLGGFLLASYAVIIGSIPFLIIEVAWTAFSIAKLIQVSNRKNPAIKKTKKRRK